MCASESGENCEWFFRCCIRAAVKLHETPLFSDRGSGILAALKTLSVGTLRYCTRHILNNIRDEFKGRCPPDIKNVLYRVQGAQSIEEYDSIIKKSSSTSALSKESCKLQKTCENLRFLQ
ncbi:hypothetical protein PHMEG_00013575 [Phytophthora megakarya]|uniref:MULE transposase domain-containing protein n=1 Tax=Phytophthora megakarya TaxID=4795 RepID=A0A225W606_9STRA|nr:hypothetical protein PHMEG_00013575 [Phytophthora megakarya]